MKTRSNSLVLFSFIAITIGSCENFLDVQPRYVQDAENYFNQPSDYEMALTAAYDLLQTSYLTQWIGEIASGNAIAGGESVTDTEGLHQIEGMTHNAVNNELRSIFRWNYAGIARVNYMMEFQNKIDFQGKNGILGQARFLRAYYYFELTKYFGDVPLVIDQRLGADQVTKLDRSPRSLVYAQIESDLRFASSTLPWSNPEKGRVDKGAALALLGKVQLYQGKHAEAVISLDSVINFGGYALVADYDTLWFAANENNSETVFDIEYSGLEGGGYGCMVCLEGNAAAGFNGIRQYVGPFYSDGNSYNLPTQDLYDAFDSTDIRRDATILDLDAFIAAQPNASSISYAIGGGGHTGFYNNKYIKRQAELGLPDNDLTSPLNYKVIRYADVLLMAAEANVQEGNDGQALSYVNSVRARVNMPARVSGGSALLADIFTERRLELSGEGLHFWDLLRSGQAAQSITNFQVGKHEIFPIPQVEIDLAGGIWSQNSGY
ncbi:MAG: RagB/SusD family nutrient uptake outer membrane protein [Schleiferiaceae bacterium]|nr:RagB/SusD family nutrient uptake outer membrane protein [Flavobacteriales bacterium]MDA9255675.1 RagB/SusD family nutrient uptake outer membrane protein [Schleiferiaceae bacterium]MDG1005414.1 RagB/SusD family nutrient uptake outer membrane protein [Schleiferiaceae bacterium]MDG2225061.1 RagB/SusD family nutrient uptake outer membrane protein [Schleiferiaceae bacterium]MDO7565898.1 RagB/SusD family nutrient uptake outer membrane protein [Schleiferiaceae bacterium]